MNYQAVGRLGSPSTGALALVTGFTLLPLVLEGGEPGREIEGPMATIVIGALFTSTLLNLLILLTLLLHYGNFNLGDTVRR